MTISLPSDMSSKRDSRRGADKISVTFSCQVTASLEAIDVDAWADAYVRAIARALASAIQRTG